MTDTHTDTAFYSLGYDPLRMTSLFMMILMIFDLILYLFIELEDQVPYLELDSISNVSQLPYMFFYWFCIRDAPDPVGTISFVLTILEQGRDHEQNKHSSAVQHKGGRLNRSC